MLSVLTQLFLIFGICLLCEGVAAVLPFPFPSSVLAMLVLLVLLAAKVLKPEKISQTSNFLLDHMAFFFLPACVSILQYADLLLENLWAVVGISLLTVPLVYAVTGATVQLTIKWMKKRKEKRRV